MRTVEIHLFGRHLRYFQNEAVLASGYSSRIQHVYSLQSMAKNLDRLEELCIENELRVTLKLIASVRQLIDIQLNGVQADFDALARGAAMLASRLEDELSLKLFFEIEPKQAELYQNPFTHWESVIARFDRTRLNIEESSKCFALERYGASVFHILQVAEYGVIQVATLMNVQGDKPGWGSLKRLQDLIKEPYPKRSQLTQTHSRLLENVVPLTVVMKDSWRHKLEHVDNQLVWLDTDFSPRVAEEIISATRGFMRKLATELP